MTITKAVITCKCGAVLKSIRAWQKHTPHCYSAQASARPLSQQVRELEQQVSGMARQREYLSQQLDAMTHKYIDERMETLKATNPEAHALLSMVIE